MFTKIRNLPLPLKILIWWSIVGEAISALAVLITVGKVSGSTTLIGVVQSLFGLLLIVGIIQRLKSVRTLLLICGWIAGFISGLGFVGTLLRGNGVAALAEILTLATCIGMVACLSANTSKSYFGLDKEGNESKLLPNQLPDPTSPSVTPAAGAAGAPSVAADH